MLKSHSMFSQSYPEAHLQRIYLPPMAGVTDLIFRRVVRYVLGERLQRYVRLSTEMISSKGIMYQANPQRMRLADDEKDKVVIQLFGHEPETMAYAAQIAQKAGAAAIDINMGCPVPKIVNGKDGAALMKEPCLAVEIAKHTVKAVDIPVSVKTRLGWNQDSINISDLALRLQDAGIKSITIHGRTRAQRYSGQADWQAIAAVRQLLDIPVYANGDINSPHSAKQALEITNAHGVACARGVIGNPWLLRDIANSFVEGHSLEQVSPSERIELLRLHVQWAYEDKGFLGVQAVKKHMKYIQGVKNASKWRELISRSQDYQEILDNIDRLQESINSPANCNYNFQQQNHTNKSPAC